MRIHATHIVILACVFVTASCSDTSFKSSDKKGDTKTVDDEDESADEPVQVSGAFLTCDWIESKKEGPGESTLIGCGVYDKNGGLFPKNDRDFQLSLHQLDDTKVTMKTSDAGSNTSFHRYAQLPSEYNDKGYLKMTVRGGSDESEFMLPTTDIGSSAALGQEGDGEETVGGVTLTHVTSQAYWEGGEYGFVDKINTSDFCRNGSIMAELSGSSQAYIAIGGLIAGDKAPPTTIKKASNTFSKDDGDGCFFTFKSDSDGSRKFAHQSQDGSCFFLRSAKSKSDPKHVLHIIKASSDSKITLENLRTFAATRPGCR